MKTAVSAQARAGCNRARVRVMQVVLPKLVVAVAVKAVVEANVDHVRP